MSSIKNGQTAMGFSSAKERTDCCAWCTHIEMDYPDRSPPFDKPSLKCKLGGFRVSQMAVCDKHVLGQKRVSQ